MLDIVCFKWKPAARYRSKFDARVVNVLGNMIKRNYQKPYRFSCITDDPKGIDPNIRIIPLWSDFANIPSAYGSRNPSCYRRLKLFSAEAKELIGERIVAIDLDVVITGDMSPIWDRPEEFVMIKSPTPNQTFYNGSMFMLTAGSRTQVWNTFDPIKSPKTTRIKRQFGSDQAWISVVLGPNEATWDQNDGVYSWRLHIDGHLLMSKFNRPLSYVYKPEKILPKNARLVIFHGADDPWEDKAQQIDWVRANWH